MGCSSGLVSRAVTATAPPTTAVVLPRVPGTTNPAVTQADIRSTICKSGWTATIRPPVSYTEPIKLTDMKVYGEHVPASDVELDHLIPLELGGNPTDPNNLWPEPHPISFSRDKTETSLRDQVCAGKIALAAAQAQISQLKHTQG